MAGTIAPTPTPVVLSATDRFTRWTLAGGRIAIGVLWLTNTRWKTPLDFGEDGGGGLYGFTKDAVDHPVLAPYSWLVDHVVLPQFRLFGWLVLLLEVFLGAFLLLGLATRFWGVVGALQAVVIGLSVARTPGEWPWSYILMVVANLTVAATAAGRYAGLDGVLRPIWSDRPGRWSRLLSRVS
ncbi:MAG TPA: TQO small subunit DoxD [Acidimicrobiales bacterium]|nr:TQO small subunit DoxD [Acidimicrobiales bacterium]